MPNESTRGRYPPLGEKKTPLYFTLHDNPAYLCTYATRPGTGPSNIYNFRLKIFLPPLNYFYYIR